MLQQSKIEMKGLLQYFKDHYQEIVVIFTALLIICVKHDYRKPAWFDYIIAPPPSWLTFAFYYGCIPLLVIVLLLRQNPLNFGFRLGKPKVWGVHVIIAGLITIPVMYMVSQGSAMSAYYSSKQFDLLYYTLDISIKLLAWEFFLRGFMLFGLQKKFGESSILIQTIPFVLLHMGKPLIEVLACIPMGLYFGYVAYRGNSMWPAFLIHLIINLSLKIFTN